MTRWRLLAVGALAASIAVSAAGAAAPRPTVPRGDLLVTDLHSRVRVLDRQGRTVRRLPGEFAAQGIALAPGRRHAFMAFLISERTAWLVDDDLATGSAHRIAHGISPALSPDGTRLAYVATAVRGGIVYRTALVVRNLRTGGSRSIPFGRRAPLDTPPGTIVNWSPDGKRVAVFDGTVIRLVAIAGAHDVVSQPTVPGEPAPSPDRSPSLAPVYLDGRTLVVLADCCIGRQHLVAVDLATGRRTPFAELSSPPETLVRLGPGRLLVVNALNELAMVQRGHVRVIARDIGAAAG